jgi:hypothetical protein
VCPPKLECAPSGPGAGGFAYVRSKKVLRKAGRCGAKPEDFDEMRGVDVVSRFDQGLRLVLRSSEDPRPGRKEIPMRVRASSPNYRDLMVLKAAVAVRQSLASCLCRATSPSMPPPCRAPR